MAAVKIVVVGGGAGGLPLVTRLGKNPAAVQVVIEEVSTENYGAGGQLIADRDAPRPEPRESSSLSLMAKSYSATTDSSSLIRLSTPAQPLGPSSSSLSRLQLMPPCSPNWPKPEM